MNTPPNDPRLLYALAGDYVLGTMRGAARRRFARWRERSPDVDQCCVFWEERLMPLMRDLRPLEPPAGVWSAIEARLALRSGGRDAHRSRRTRRWLAIAASMLIAVAAAFVWQRSRIDSAPLLESATLAASDGVPIWQIRVLGRAESAGVLEIRTSASAAPPPARAYQLWALPKGQNPVSLGVLPAIAGASRQALDPRQWQALLAADRVAVSIEPPGGSPTGQPTGAIAFVGPLARGG